MHPKQPNDDEDRKLIRELVEFQSGNVEAFGSIAERVAPFMFRVIVARGEQEADANDIVQDVLVKLFQVLPQKEFGFAGQLFKYCERSVIRRWLDTKKKWDNRTKSSLEATEEQTAVTPTPEEAAMLKELKGVEETCAQELSPDNQEIWWLRYRWSNPEIAEKFNMTAQQVARRFCTILQKMRDCMTRKLDGEVQK